MAGRVGLTAAAIGLLLPLGLGPSGCRSTGTDGPHAQAGSSVRISGSDTMLILGRRLAERFMRSNPGIAVEVEGGGTAVGLAALAEGRVDLAAASRPAAPEEVSALHRRFDALGVRFLVGQDALSVWVHPSNPVEELTLAELAGLFTGEIRDWSAVGGPDLPVRVVVRPPTSGTHRFFRDRVLSGRRYAPGAEVEVRTVDVLGAVGSDPAAIGYGGLAYAEGVRPVPVAGVPPAPAEVRSGRYPLTRYLHYYSTAPPDGAVKRFLDWTLGPEGQEVVTEVGYVPIWDRGGGTDAP